MAFQFRNVLENHTKQSLGVALHLEFHEPDGSLLNLDVDVSPPTIPVMNISEYDGSNTKKREWLERNRPVNWLPEWRKSQDMREAVRYLRLNKNYSNKSLMFS